MAIPIESTLLTTALVYAALRGEMFYRQYRAKKSHDKYQRETKDLFYPKSRKLSHTVRGGAEQRECGICHQAVNSYHQFSGGHVECIDCNQVSGE